MHREISHSNSAFAPQRNLGLYLMTALLGLILAGDIALWLASGRSESPPIVFGFRLAIVAAVLGGARILYTSIEALLEGRLGADLALAIACIASIYLKEYLVAAEIVFIGMAGECLEGFTFERTQRAIRQLVEVCPRRCFVLRDGQEVRVFTSELQVGDLILVKPGARVPVDGVVVDGRSAVDVSALTGETLPVDKGAGDEVLAGSLNQFGALTISAERVAEHTVVGRVIELTARALREKAPLERTADRLARWFLPAVLGLATLTFVAGYLHFGAGVFRTGGRMGFSDAFEKSLIPAVTVLVVACPCALILATPAAIIAALGRLAGTGVLLKGGGALERLATVTAIAFDKTGTLTEGRLELGDVVGFDGISGDEVLRAAAAAEKPSEHLLARLIVHEAAVRKLTLEPVEDFQAHPGAGVSGKTTAGRLLVGTPRLLEEHGVALPTAVADALARLDSTGQTALLVARNGVVLGAIGARDKVREEALHVLQELAGLGIRDIVLLSGDRRAAAAAVASALGISEVHAELLPQQKCDLVAALRTAAEPSGNKRDKGPRSVAMVGDGINDAPALASADVGIAIASTGTDIAAEAGDIVMMGAPLRPLPLLVRLSRETVRIIRQNIVIFAFGVNGFGIVLTAWLWPLLVKDDWWYNLGPLAGVIYHQLGSLAVLLNSMRLLWFERRLDSPKVTRVRDTFKRLDSWVEKYLDVDEALHWLSHQWRRVLAGCGVLLALIWVLSGLTQIGPDETAIVLRFGKPSGTLEPGLTWCWPWPIDRVVRVKVDRIRTVQIGVADYGSSDKAALAWDSPHLAGAMTPDREDIGEQTLMITGDHNLVEVQATVRYRIQPDKLAVYLFQVRDADTIVRSASESVLRSLVASRRLTVLLTTGREELQREAIEQLQKRCTECNLGIDIEGFALHDLHPPLMVVDAYHEVTKAMEQRDREINDARKDAVLTVGAAEADLVRITLKAEVARTKEIYDAQVKWVEFLAYAGARKKQPEIIDLRLYYDRLARALLGRDVLLIDAEKINGRRLLVLPDLDQMRLPLPSIVPLDRGLPPRSGPGDKSP